MTNPAGVTDEMVELTEGDVFRWRYREESGLDLRSWGTYHCCSCIAIMRNGRLRDTYWYGDGRSFGVGDVPRLELERRGNLSELEPAKEYQADYYDDADIVNLTHANGGEFYLRKGAVRSQAKMLAAARSKLEASQSDERMAAWRSERLRESIAKIEAGDTNAFI